MSTYNIKRRRLKCPKITIESKNWYLIYASLLTAKLNFWRVSSMYSRKRDRLPRDMKNTMLISFQYSATQPQQLFWKVAGRRTFEKLPNMRPLKKNIHYSEIALYWNVTTTRLIFGLVFRAFFPCVACIIIFFGQKTSSIHWSNYRKIVSCIAIGFPDCSINSPSFDQNNYNDFTRDALIF